LKILKIEQCSEVRISIIDLNGKLPADDSTEAHSFKVIDRPYSASWTLLVDLNAELEVGQRGDAQRYTLVKGVKVDGIRITFRRYTRAYAGSQKRLSSITEG
jgi:hypothetical protein